jgi:hypothetical protein
MRKGNFERLPTRAIREAVYKTADVYCHLCMSFHNYADVPHEIRDPTSDLTFELQPAWDIEVVYRRSEVLSAHH